MAKAKSKVPLLRRMVTGFQSMISNIFAVQSAEFKTLLYIVMFMTGLGLVMVLSSSYANSLMINNGWFGEARTQLFGVLLGGFALVVFANLDPNITKRFARFALIGGLLLQSLVFTFLGKEVNGNRNWLNFGIFTVQPSEFLKIALILFVAMAITSRPNVDKGDYKFWIMPALGFAGIAIATMLGKDVGTVIVMALILYGMFYLGGLPWQYVKLLTLAALIAIPIAMVSSSSRWARVLAWWNPNAPDPAGVNWQATHGKWAFAAGGFFGTGLGNSKMKWSWLPEAQNDFIFAIIGEEWGFLGAALTIALFVALGITMFKIARKTVDDYQRMVVYGVTFWIMSQAFVNISVVLTMFPVLGVNLPLISAGGSSMIATLLAIGIVLGIERENSLKPSLKVVRGGSR